MNWQNVKRITNNRRPTFSGSIFKNVARSVSDGRRGNAPVPKPKSQGVVAIGYSISLNHWHLKMRYFQYPTVSYDLRLPKYFITLRDSQQHHQNMDIQALKLDLVQKILNSNNQTLLFRVNNILKKEVEKDWWDQLPHEIQDSIFEGIHDIETGKVFTHEQVMEEAKQKYGF